MKIIPHIIVMFFFLGTVCLYGQTDVSGIINGQTWTAAGSPYVVNDHLIIQDLTIEPGVTVAFNGNWECRVTGTLIAIGTRSDSIFFVNHPGSMVNWLGIIIEDTSAVDTLKFVRITDASPTAVTIRNSVSYLESCQISGNNGNGVVCSGGAAKIFRSDIVNNTGNGIVAESGGAYLIKAAKILSNGNKGISLNNGSAELENVIVAKNTQAGIDLETVQDTLIFSNIVISDHEFVYAINAKNGIISGRNSIVYFNASSPIRPGSATFDIAYSNIQGGFSGEGNFSSDPEFSDDLTYALSSGSPCIDSGDPDPRFNDICFPPSMGNVRNDVGAYGGPGACEWLDQIFVYPDSVDFGMTTVGIPKDTILNIQNARGHPLNITHIDLSGIGSDAFSVDTANFPLGPYENRSVKIQFHPDAEQGYTANLEFSSSGGTAIVPLSGSGQFAIFEANPTNIDFKTVAVGSVHTIPVTIENISDGLVRIDSLKFTDDRFYHQHQLPIELPPGTDSIDSIFIHFEPDTIGYFQGQIEFFDNHPGNIKIFLSGSGKAPIIYTPLKVIELGDIHAGQDTVTRILIENRGTDTLRIQSRRLGSTGFYFSLADTSGRIEFPPGSAPDTIKVRFHPQAAIDDTASLLILSNDPFNDTLSVALNGRGVKPDVQVSADSIKFGEVIVNIDKSKDITIKNSGNAELIIGEDVTIFAQSPDDSSFRLIDNPAGSIISANDSISFQVSFLPKKENEVYTAKLSIPTNDIQKDTLDLDLSGKSVLPVLSLPGLIDFGGIVIGQESIITLEIKNSGTGTLIIDSLYFKNPEQTVFTLSDFQLPDSLLPETDTLSLNIRFAPPIPGKWVAQIYILTNLPGSAKLDSFSVSGTGLKPLLSLSHDTVSFDLTYITDPSVWDTVFVSNAGNGKLQIDSLIFTPRSDSLDFNYAFHADRKTLIDSLLVDTVFIEFKPEMPGARLATLLVYSNDPESFPDPDTLNLKGIAKSPVIISVADKLEFDTTFVDSDTTKFLKIENRGDRDLKILALEFADPNDAQFSAENIGSGITVIPGSTDSLAITFKPGNEGPVNGAIRIISNDPINDTVTVSLSGTGKTDPEPAQIMITTFPDSLSVGEDYTIQIMISGNQAPVSWCNLMARPGARSDFDTLAMNLSAGSDSLWETQLPGYLITERGLEYYIEVRHGGRLSDYPTNGNSNPQYQQVHIPLLRYPGSTRINDYQMISLPVESNDRTLASLFGDTLGGYDNTLYRIFEYDSGYYELNDMDRALPRGKALWLITRDSQKLIVRNVMSPAEFSIFPIPVKKGWNMISVPFPFPVSTHILDPAVISGGVFYNWTGNEWQKDITTLMPYDGYAVYALVDTVLHVPPIASPAGLPKENEKPFILPDWQITISATRGRYRDAKNIAGVLQGALAGFDRFDLPEPPSPGNFVSVYFHNPVTPLTADLRAPDTSLSGYRFDFSVISNFTGTTRLEFGSENLPAGYGFIVVSDQTGVRYDPAEQINISANHQDMVLLVGETAFIEQATASYQLLPLTYRLDQNFPNPFNPATTIKYTLPVAEKVDLIVYDILGKVVKNLLSGSFHEAGYHSVTWDGTNNQHVLVASGIYFLTLRTAAYHHSVKMLLQR